jgi:hypothetical protein
MRNSCRVGWNTLLALAFVRLSGAIAGAAVMNLKTKKCWGTIVLQMALDARQEGDLVTAELLVAHAMDYFQEADRLASRWRRFEARHGGELRGMSLLSADVGPAGTKPSGCIAGSSGVVRREAKMARVRS